jgi:hypothetical protein
MRCIALEKRLAAKRLASLIHRTSSLCTSTSFFGEQGLVVVRGA